MKQVIPEQKIDTFFQNEITIHWNQELNSLKKSLHDKDLQAFLILYEQSVKNPKEAYKPLMHFMKKYPKVPEIINLFTYICLQLKKNRKADHFIRKNYLFNPENLLARINYADSCLRNTKPRKVGEIFLYSDNLAWLYPNRQEFHISEYRGFQVMMGFYKLSQKNIEHAEKHLYLAHFVDKEHCSVLLLNKHLQKEIKKQRRYLNLGSWKRTFSSV